MKKMILPALVLLSGMRAQAAKSEMEYCRCQVSTAIALENNNELIVKITTELVSKDRYSGYHKLYEFQQIHIRVFEQIKNPDIFDKTVNAAAAEELKRCQEERKYFVTANVCPR